MERLMQIKVISQSRYVWHDTQSLKVVTILNKFFFILPIHKDFLLRISHIERLNQRLKYKPLHVIFLRKAGLPFARRAY